MANVALPGTSGFVGEWMVILAAMHANFWIAFGAAFTLFLAAAFTLWLIKRVLFGRSAMNTWPRCRTSTRVNSWCWVHWRWR